MEEQQQAHDTPKLPELRWGWVWLAAVLTVIATVAAVLGLVSFARSGGAPQQVTAELSALRTALTITVGGGGAIALWLAVRRQRSSELQLHETRRIEGERGRRETAAAAANEEDARERRITELYSIAVEQLGSEKAPVRLGGIYALERLALQNEEHEQTIINVLCAYLRMSFEVSLDAGTLWKPEIAYSPTDNEDVDSDELQVRIAAQEAIRDIVAANHSDTPTAEAKIFVNLAGATLVNFMLRDCTVAHLEFSYAKFLGITSFYGVQARRWTICTSARFFGPVDFSSCALGLVNDFSSCRFDWPPRFANTSFGYVNFLQSDYRESTVEFYNTTFKGLNLNTVHYKGSPFTLDQEPGLFRFHNAHAEKDAALEEMQPPLGWKMDNRKLVRDHEGTAVGLR
ncbi:MULTISPECIES: pentapeptide repeat-containing protein [Prauserella salsuginis group]|uniref:Pentapeptide repeat-containing protein n=1 Tax=Prauserella salsuginis TaxID=387889 RepID=A0ABW6G290_9PSEU|nr:MULTISPECIES: pentapeptide repeat-containing protein [Prauserella salsuginis group]